MENKANHFVSIIVAASNLDTLMENFSTLAKQTYSDIEIIIVNSIQDIDIDAGTKTSSEKLQDFIKKFNKCHIELVKFVKRFGYSFEPISSNEMYLLGAEKAKGDYLLFCDDNISYSPCYVESLVNEISKEEKDIAFTDTVISWSEQQASRYSYEISFPKDKSIFSVVAEQSKNLYGLYSAENKLIKKSVWKEASESIIEFYKDGNHAALYCGEIIFGFSVWSKVKKPIYVKDAYSKIAWKDDDKKVSEYADSRNLSSVAAEIMSALDYAKTTFENNDVSDETYSKFCDGFLSRIIWRIDWKFPTLKEVCEEKLELKITKFSIVRVFSGRITNIDLEEMKRMSNDSAIDKDADSDLNIKIFVGVHKPSFIPTNNKYICPIQLGSSYAEKRFPDMLHDDEGDNISDKKEMYCELSAQYWAWKNVTDADYYGFWHYRRYFSFNMDEEEDEGMVKHDVLNDESLKQSFIDEYHIAKACENYDIIIPHEWHIEDPDSISLYEHWCRHFNKKDLDILMDIILENYPHFYNVIIEALQSKEMFVCNLFIMNKELFNEYSEFLFTILDEAEKRVDLRRYNVEQNRLLGHFGERLLDIFMKYIIKTRPEVRIGYVKRTLYKDTRPYTKIVHPNKDNCVSIMLACEDDYMKYTDVLLESIYENSSDEYFYDIVICHRDITEKNQRIAKSIFAKKNNFLIRFADVTRNFEKYNKVHVYGHFTYETYYRFLVLDIFENYDRILYLDCDMVVNTDISKLFFTPMNDEYVAAVRDYDFIAECVHDKEMLRENVLKHIKIDDYFNYFQAGVLLFNLAALKTKFTSEDIFKVAISRNWFYLDQDILNSMFNGHVKYLDDRWNVFSMLKTDKEIGRYFLLRKELAAQFAVSYQKSRKDPYIIHFAGVPKVWDDSDVDFGDYFWKYARNSPLYEQLLKNTVTGVSVMQDWIMFGCKGSDNRGEKFFTLKTIKVPWNSTYAIIDVVHTRNLQYIEDDVLVISIDNIINEEGQNKLVLRQFCWERRIPDLVENVMYKFNDDHDLEIYVRTTDIYNGYFFKVRILESKCDYKPIITVNNHKIVENNRELPDGLRKGW